MKELEDIVQNQRDLFDLQDPPSGHEERFSRKLDRWHRRQHTLHYAMNIAASFVLISSLTISAYLFRKKEAIQQPITGLTQVSNEFRETTQYYDTKLNEKMQQLKSLPCIDEQQREKMLAEVNDLDQNDRQLMVELGKDPNNQMIIDAIINQYQTKLEILNKLVNQLSPICKRVNTYLYENNGAAL